MLSNATGIKEGNIMVEDFKTYLLREHKSLNTINTYCRCINEYKKWYHENKNKDIFGMKTDYLKVYESYLKDVKKQKNPTIMTKLCAINAYSIFLKHTNI